MEKLLTIKKTCNIFSVKLLLMVGMLLIQHIAVAQNQVVKFSKEKMSIYQAFSEIEKQTSFTIAYSKNLINGEKIVKTSMAPIVLDAALKAILTPDGLTYDIKASHIIIKKKEVVEPTIYSGVIKDQQTGDAIMGATILLSGTTNGTTTNEKGEFSLKAPQGSGIQISFIGYESQDVTLGAQSSVVVSLKPSMIGIDNVVVTALGIKRSEKALSYNVQQIEGESILAAKDVNFVNSLNGRVAGVTINASSAGVGGASKVVMRGTKSIMQTSNALYVIDGVPMLMTARDGSTEFGSQGTTDPIADINPEDIASISVLNGAAAAALYGSDAANGAIVVTTKRGQAGHTEVTVSSNTEIMTPFSLPKFQNRYGTGDYASSEGSNVRSWGHRLNSDNYYGYDPASDYFQTGVTGTESVSLSTGTDKNQTYMSAAAVNSRGIVPNNRYDRYNFSFRNTTKFLDDKMTLNVGAGYVIQKDRNMVNQGEYSNPVVGAYIFPRGNDWNDIKMYERWDVSRGLYTQYWQNIGDAGMTMQNPYWINYRNLVENRKDRYLFDAALSYDMLSWLNVTGRIRVDNSSNTYTEKNYASTNTQRTEGSLNGLFGLTKADDRQVYGDVLVNINKKFGDDWSLQANIGASISDMRSDISKTRGPIRDGIITDEAPSLANVFNVQNLSNTAITERLQEGWREQTQSIFASTEIGYKSTYFLTLTGRNDWPSQLAGPHSQKSSYFYHSLGASVVVSQLIPQMPKDLSYVKLRASYASVGVAFERFIANPMYEYDVNGLNWNTQTSYPVYNLKPERTKSFEIGLTMRFLRHFNLDLTYYNTKTQDQTFSPELSAGAAASKIYVQSGNVRNRGVELALNYDNTWSKFQWNTAYTLSVNRNKILSLANNIVNPTNGQLISIDLLDMKGLDQAHFLLRKGGTLGDLYSLTDFKRDNNGDIYMDEKGNLATESIKNPDDYIKLGSVLPDANMSWRNDFRWKNVNFGFMMTARLGGIVYSKTQAKLDYYGVSDATAVARDAGGVMINGGDLVDANKWYTSVAGGTPVAQFYTYSATNVRLSEVSVGYTIPRRALHNVCEITVSLVGRNLWMIYNKAPFDPETIATTGNFYQGIDNFMMPSLRNIGFNLRLKF